MNRGTFVALLPVRWLNRFSLSPTDLLRDRTYRRLWTSILISSFGGQVTLLAIPLTAAVLMHASPTQMGVLTAMELIPFALFSLPTGALLGGWLGEHVGLRSALGFSGVTALLLACVAWQLPVIRSVKTLPTLKAEAVTPYSSDSQ